MKCKGVYFGWNVMIKGFMANDEGIYVRTKEYEPFQPIKGAWSLSRNQGEGVACGFKQGVKSLSGRTNMEVIIYQSS